MAKTFLQLTNELLDEVNEVQLTAANFADARNIQRYAKTCINRAYRDINTDDYKWPWNADSHQGDYLGNQYIETVAGQRWYLLNPTSTSYDTDFAHVDTRSFQLSEEGVAGKTAPYEIRNLLPITAEDWRRHRAASEARDDSDTGTHGVPSRVLISPDNRQVGLSPIPDGVYRIYFYAWNQIGELSAYNDTLTLPDRFSHVLIAKARAYIWKHKENSSESDRAEKDFKDGLKRMREAVAPFPEYMSDDRIRSV